MVGSIMDDLMTFCGEVHAALVEGRPIPKRVRRQDSVELAVEEMDSNAEGDAPGGEDAVDLMYFHVTSRCHLRTKYLAMDRPKEILGEQCQHYARLFGARLLDYCFMDNHFHLVLGIERDRVEQVLPKLVGCIKQQFTRYYKEWFNVEYRPTDRYRQPKLGKGTLWDGSYFAQEIDDFSYLMACTLYVENNRLEAECSEEPPESDEELVERLMGYKHQSGRWYLAGRQGCETYLTDGCDGVWATDDEMAQYWTLPKSALPEGWRKVWCKGMEGILKQPEEADRRYAHHPFVDGLGETAQAQGEALAQHLVAAFRARRRVEAGEAPTQVA